MLLLYDSITRLTVAPLSSSAYLYNVHYTAPLAIIRLVLLLVPLPYHSFSGTALKCPFLYKCLYVTTLLLVLYQMLGIMILDPDSLSTILFGEDDDEDDRRELLLVLQRLLLDHSSLHHAMRKIWLVLVLTLTSTLLHLVLFHHVRSTAPTTWMLSSRRQDYKHHVLYFYTSRGNSGTGNDDDTLNNGDNSLNVNVLSPGGTPSKHGPHVQYNNNNNGNGANNGEQQPNGSILPQRHDLLAQMRRFPSEYDGEF